MKKQTVLNIGWFGGILATIVDMFIVLTLEGVVGIVIGSIFMALAYTLLSYILSKFEEKDKENWEKEYKRKKIDDAFKKINKGKELLDCDECPKKYTCSKSNPSREECKGRFDKKE